MAEIVKTIKPSGGDYSSLSAWEAGEQTDLVAAGNIAVADCHNMEDTAPVVISGWTTDTSNYIVIRGYSGDKSSSNTGKWSTDRYRLVTAATGDTTPSINIQAACVKIIDLQIQSTPGVYGNAGGILCRTGALSVIIAGCIVRKGGSSGGNFSDGIQSWSTGQSTALYVINCIIYGFGNSYCSGVDMDQSTGTCYAYSTLMVNNYWGLRVSSGTTTAKNCYAGGNGSADYSGISTKTTCASSDTSGSTGLQNISVNTSNFVNVTAGLEDFHLVSGSDLIDVGTDTSGESAPLNFTDDIDGNTRSGTWDVGADEFSGGTIESASITESASATDSQSAIVSFQASMTENASASDSVAAAMNTSASIGESATASDYQTSFAVRNAFITETANATDTSDAVVIAGGASIVESANASDSCSAVIIAFASIIETSNSSDSCSSTRISQVSITEIANATDTSDVDDSIDFETQMENVLFGWILPIIGLWEEGRDENQTPRAGDQPIMVWHMQNAPRPATPILEGRISSIVKIGRDVVNPPDHSGNARISGTREFMLYLQYFGDSALDAMLKIRDACEDPEHLDILFAAGITSVEASPPIDAHEFLGTMPEDRAVLDIRFRTTMEWTANIGMPIENVQAEGVLVTGNVNDAVEIDLATT